MSAPTAARAAKGQTIDSTGGTIFSATNFQGAATICIRVGSDSVHDLLVNIPALHGVNVWALVAAGDKEYFRCKSAGILEVNAKGDGGDASVVSWHVAAITER